jgi:hypothetical protein
MPKNFRDSLAEARAQLNFAVNLMLVGFLVLALYATLAITHWSLPAFWLPAALVAISALGYFTALSSLTVYGTYVKSAFDLFRADLAKHLGLCVPPSSTQEGEMWVEVSRMMTYRSAAAWDRLEKYRD